MKNKALSTCHIPLQLFLVSSLIYNCYGTATSTTTTSTRAPTSRSWTTPWPGQDVFTQGSVTSSGGSPMDGSILQTCAGTLFPPDSNMLESGINISDTSQVVNGTFSIICRHYHDYFDCLRTELDTRQNLSTIDIVMFGIMDINGAESSYTAICSNIEYIMENVECMANLGLNAQMMSCISNFAPRLLEVLNPDNPSSLCSTFASYSDCLQKPLLELCDEDFVSFIYNLNLQSLVPECRRLVTGGVTNSTEGTPTSSTILTSTIDSENGTFTSVNVTVTSTHTVMSTHTTVQSSPDDPSKGTCTLSWSFLLVFMTSLTLLLF